MAEVKQEIILGLGKFMIDDVEIALTRGGGSFVLEREYRSIEADGMKATGKDMIVIDREQPKLTMNALSIFTGADLTKFYPAMESEEVATPSAGTKITSALGLRIKEADYHAVSWVGQTNKGQAVKISIANAVNLENIDWSLVDKEEAIQTLTFTGTAEMDVKQCDWSIEFLSA